MPSSPLSQLAAILVQLGISVLVTILFVSLRREALHREYYRFWIAGWFALTVALVVVGLRHGLVPGLFADQIAAKSGPGLIVLHTVYQISKLLFLGCLLLGAISLARPNGVSRFQATAIFGVAVLLGLATGALPATLDNVMVWQSIVAVPTFAAAAWWASQTPRERRGLGVAILVAALVAHATLWAIYFIGFLQPFNLDTAWDRALSFLVGNNSFIDAVAAFVLSLGMLVTAVDHSHRDADREQRSQLEKTAQSERQLAEVLRATQDGIFTLDADRKITALTPAAERTFAVTTSAAVGEVFDRFLVADELETLWHDLAVTVRRSEAHPPVAMRREVTGRRADGTGFPLEVAISSIDAPGSRGYVVVARDLTQQYQLNEEREQLQQQVAQAARLETVGRMVSGVAHELNNPLTAILAFAQDLLATHTNAEDREALTVIVEQAERCRVIVGDLLIFARSRREERRRVTPNEVVQRVVRVFERDSSRHGVQLEVDVAPDLPALEIDVVGIEQVLTNLLTNAFQATARGGHVQLRARAIGKSLEFVAQDTGPGIPPEVLARVFEPFFTTKEPGHGTGLGLSVSHAIVQQHGGFIRAENRDDGPTGARFTVGLPFVDRRVMARDGRTESQTVAPELAVVPEAAKRRVLVVDDEESIRIAMRRTLERRGWSVDEAADGGEAMLKLDVGGRAASYDVIVTDLRMPGVSGVELFQRLSTLHPALAARTVVITGDTASPSVAEFLAKAGRPYLQKPFDMRLLADMIERVATQPIG